MQVVKKGSSRRKKVLTAALVAALISGGVIAVAAIQNIGPFKEGSSSQEINYEEPTEEQVKAGEDIKQQAIDNVKPTDAASGSDAPVTSPANNGTVGVEITQAEVTGSTLKVRTLIQELSNSGTCTLTLSKSGQSTVSRSAKVQALANSSTCQGFNIDVASLAKGTWSVKVSYSSNKSNGSASQQVTL